MRQTIQMTRRRFFASCFMLLILVIAVTGYSMLTTLAEEEPVQGLPYYSSIEIQEGDSLWKIADRYRKGSRMTTQEICKTAPEDEPTDRRYNPCRRAPYHCLL